MKKFFALLALVLGVVSCQTEPEGFDVNTGAEQDAVITVALPEGTRANSAEGAFDNVDLENLYDVRFQCEVYYGDNETPKVLPVQISDKGTTATFPVRLIANRDYKFVVWADLVEQGSNADLHYNTANGLKEIEIIDWKAMDESRDAYTCAETRRFERGTPINLTLTRPFAKLRVVTTDMNELMGIMPTWAKVMYATPYYDNFNAFDQKPYDLTSTGKAHEELFDIVAYETEESIKETSTKTLFTDYFFAINPEAGQAPETVAFTMEVFDENGATIDEVKNFTTSIPVKRNYLTTIKGDILTYGDKIVVTIEDAFDGDIDHDYDNDVTTSTVNTAEELQSAFEENSPIDVVVLNGDINLNDLFADALYTRAEQGDITLTVKSDKNLTIDLNGNTLSATSSQTGKNYNMFDVRGILTVKNGTIEYEHVGENMGWNASTNLFNVTAGGVLNLDGVTAKNLGGSDMGFVAHLNNWGKVTLNVENSTLESNYVAVRVFNSGPDMNNVTIKNSTLKGGNYAFWVHNYTVEDFGTEAKAEAQKALLNLNIYNQGNSFSPDVNGIRYGFTNSIKTDARGITKVVSEDGTEVTLGSIVENGVIRRGVAGDEENTTIKKVVVEEGVGVLYDRTFRRFYALEEVVLPNTLTVIGEAGSGVFQSCNNLKKVVLPESLTVLGKGSFQECTSLESINIPAGVTRIESDALRNTGLKSVEFHADVTYFGAQAFRDCKQLTEVVINAPEFTMEGNTFGIMAAPYTPMTIRVANAEMKAYVESKLTAHAKTYITVVVLDYATTAEELAAKMAEGKNVVLANDLTDAAVNTKAPYGNYYGIAHNGGVFNGGGYSLDFERGTQNSNGKYDNYGIMTSGGTIKNVAISGVFRGIMIMYPSKDIYVDNVTLNDPDDYGVCYTINTGEGDGTHSLYVSNSTLNGWTSIGTAVKAVNFTNCTFGQGLYYTNVFGRLVKPYVDAVFENCDFCNKFYIDLSAFEGSKVVIKNCTVNGMKITAENWTSLVAPEETCGNGQISVELKDGTYLTAENVVDYIVFE